MNGGRRIGITAAIALAVIGGGLVLAAGCNAVTGAGKLEVGAGGGGRAQSSSSGTTSTSSSSSSSASSASSSSSSGAGGGGGASCSGVTCSGHGSCVVQGPVAVCMCQGGYHAVGLTCVVDGACTASTCGTCADCQVIGGVATCVCPMDYALQGKDCKLSIDPCANANCTVDQSCVPEAHCQALGACVDKCDCSNCPNCAPDNSDGRWNDWQEYCGAQPNQSPATMACTKPCKGGEGCLPYAVQICWPLEGCFSL